MKLHRSLGFGDVGHLSAVDVVSDAARCRHRARKVHGEPGAWWVKLDDPMNRLIIRVFLAGGVPEVMLHLRRLM